MRSCCSSRERRCAAGVSGLPAWSSSTFAQSALAVPGRRLVLFSLSLFLSLSLSPSLSCISRTLLSQVVAAFLVEGAPQPLVLTNAAIRARVLDQLSGTNISKVARWNCDLFPVLSLPSFLTPSLLASLPPSSSFSSSSSSSSSSRGSGSGGGGGAAEGGGGGGDGGIGGRLSESGGFRGVKKGMFDEVCARCWGGDGGGGWILTGCSSYPLNCADTLDLYVLVKLRTHGVSRPRPTPTRRSGHWSQRPLVAARSSPR